MPDYPGPPPATHPTHSTHPTNYKVANTIDANCRKGLKIRICALILGACKRTRPANKRFPMRWPPKEIIPGPATVLIEMPNPKVAVAARPRGLKKCGFAHLYIRRMQPPIHDWNQAWWVHQSANWRVNKLEGQSSPPWGITQKNTYNYVPRCAVASR